MYSFSKKAHLVSTIFRISMVVMVVAVIGVTNSLGNSDYNASEQVEIVNSK